MKYGFSGKNIGSLFPKFVSHFGTNAGLSTLIENLKAKRKTFYLFELKIGIKLFESLALQTEITFERLKALEPNDQVFSKFFHAQK